MTETTEMTDLDAGFRALKTQSAVPSADLLARVLADGLAVQESAGYARTAPVAAPSGGGVGSLLAEVRALFGGWQVLAGFAASVAIGVWIGLHPPQAFEATAGDDGFYVVDLSPEDSFALIEESL